MYNDEKYCEDDEIANAFNKYFSSVGKTVAESLPSVSNDAHTHYLPRSISNSFFFSPVTYEDICSVIMSLKNKRDTRSFPAVVLKSLRFILAPILSYLINLSLSTGIFPNSLKLAKVVPIYKGGDKTNVANYRPISILSLISKVIEKNSLQETI